MWRSLTASARKANARRVLRCAVHPKHRSDRACVAAPSHLYSTALFLPVGFSVCHCHRLHLSHCPRPQLSCHQIGIVVAFLVHAPYYRHQQRRVHLDWAYFHLSAWKLAVTYQVLAHRSRRAPQHQAVFVYRAHFAVGWMWGRDGQTSNLVLVVLACVHDRVKQNRMADLNDPFLAVEYVAVPLT